MSDPFVEVRRRTDVHRARHGCWAFPFSDGSILGVLAGTVRARRILELGTALGYTALWLAYGSPGATVDTVESDPEHSSLAEAHIREFGYATRIKVHRGEFSAVLPHLEAGYDLAFFDGFSLDADDLRAMLGLLRPTGVLIAANLGLQRESKEIYLSALEEGGEWITTFALEGGNVAVSVRRNPHAESPP